MLETSSILAAYASFALLHAADPRRLPRPLALSSRLWWPNATRLAAVVAFAVAVVLSGCSGDWTAAPLVALAALMASASIFVLLAPIMPRVIWGIALCAPVAVPALAFLGGACAF